MSEHLNSLEKLTSILDEQANVPTMAMFNAQILWAVQWFLIDMKKENNQPLEEWSLDEIVRVAIAGTGKMR